MGAGVYSERIVRPGDRGAAFIGYGLMFFAPFMAGAPVLVAAGIAFAHRGSDDPIARSHVRNQLRTIGQDLVLAVIGFLCGWAALLGGILEILHLGVQAAQSEPVRFAIPAVAVVSLALAWAVCWIIAVISLFVTPAIGAIRLASGRPARKTPGL